MSDTIFTMRLSTRARYALRMLLDVARNGGNTTPVSLASVAERTDLSRGYLEQVALALRNAGIIRGVAGRRGGYQLAAEAGDITIRQVIEATIGPINLVDCIEDPTTCLRSEFCECRVVYQMINCRIAEVLQAYTLADLLDPSWVRVHGDPVSDGSGKVGWIDGHGCSPVSNRSKRKARR